MLAAMTAKMMTPWNRYQNMDDVSDKIVGAESGGNATATNPNSSATGAGQFIASTWLDTLAKHRPDLTGSPDELLALRNDPQLSKEMTAAYAGDNQAHLAKNGLPVTPGTTYLAHFAGPQGAVGILSADPSAPAASVLGAAAVKANPFLANMTAGDVAAWANRKMGGGAPPAVAGPVPAPQMSPPLNIAPRAAPMFAQAPPAAPQAAPQQQADAGPSFQAPAGMQAPPIFASPRPRVDLTKLRAAFPQQNFYAKG